MSTWERYLNKYRDVADEWLSEDVARRHFEFFKNFFDKEKLKNADWAYFQTIGDYIHAFNSMPLAKANALGRINAPIEHYRKVFLYLAHGDDPPELRAQKFMDDEEYDLPYFGESAKTEIIGHVFPDLYLFKNIRDEKALRLFQIDPGYDKKDSFFGKLDKFSYALKPVVDDYKRIVGQRTKLPINIEVDQFFSWVYQKYGKNLEDIEITDAQMEMLRDRFNERMPDFVDFTNPGQLAEEELDYKRAALRKFDEFGGADKLREMIAAGNALEAANAVRNTVGLNLTHYTSWQRTFGTTEEQAALVLSSFLDSAEKPYTGLETTKPIFDALREAELPAIWDSITNILWALNPNEYWPVKITLVRKLAAELGIKISGQGRPNKKRFDEIYRFGQAFKTALDQYSPRDMTDVQSYMWVVMWEAGSTDRYWAYSPGRKAKFWDEFKTENIIAIGWDYLGDLHNYPTQDSIEKAIQEKLGTERGKKNSSLACFEFANVMKEGDYVFVKKGGRKLLGYGKVVSGYRFDQSREEFKHVRDVEWISIGEWELADDKHIAVKTLTDFTKYPDYVAFMKTLVTKQKGGDDRPPIPHPSDDQNYYWLNANPNHWDIKSVDVGVTQSYSYENERGNPRRIKKHFDEIKEGDLLIGYTTSPDRMITTRCQVTKALHDSDGGKRFEFVIVEQIINGVTWSELQAIPELENSEPLRNNQGSLFKLTEEEFGIIQYLIDECNPNRPDYKIEKYTRDNALDELFIDGQQLDEILFQLRNKKNVVLQGPPGVGKTFIARRLAWLLMGENNKEQIEMIQFHQSYSYEDFMQGYRPNENGGFELKNGIFFDFCLRAQRDPDKPFVFVIDEINRGNLSRIFGELMMLIEADKRGKQFAVPLTYSTSRDERFYIPENIHVIGTMNTADRSLALVDYALRRRFVFFDLDPAFNMPNFRKLLTDNGISTEIVRMIIERFNDLNEHISKDTKSLGEGFRIGHSYFCRFGDIEDQEHWYNTIIDTEIAPLLREYWFDDESRVNTLVNRLRNG